MHVCYILFKELFSLPHYSVLKLNFKKKKKLLQKNFKKLVNENNETMYFNNFNNLNNTLIIYGFLLIKNFLLMKK